MVYGCYCGCRVTNKLHDFDLEQYIWKGGATTIKCPFCKADMYEEKRIEDNENIICTQVEKWIERTPDMVL